MKRLCIIPCGAKKIWDINENAGATKAKDAYLSTFHQFCQSYATTFFDEWVILSAKHGFLQPNDIVNENYNLAFDHKSSEIISVSELKSQLLEKEMQDYEEIIVLGGKKYYKVVEKIFEPELLRYPLKNCKGIGYMNQRLKLAVQTSTEIL